jgi:hypothetical protein
MFVLRLFYDAVIISLGGLEEMSFGTVLAFAWLNVGMAGLVLAF